MPIPPSAFTNRKAAGFTFTKNQITELASRIYGEGYEKNIVAFGVVDAALEDDEIGFLFDPILVPDGMDADKDEDDVRQYMVVLVVEDLGAGETLETFLDFLFEDYREDPDVVKALDWFEKYGYSKEKMIERWATFSEWSFRRSKESWY